MSELELELAFLRLQLAGQTHDPVIESVTCLRLQDHVGLQLFCLLEGRRFHSDSRGKLLWCLLVIPSFLRSLHGYLLLP